jgi:GntR family transcriptional repressor for pyruvate dehydrogenase complex
VREAIRALEAQGLIVSRSGMGNFVADLPVESLVAPLAKMLVEEKDALASIFELRKLIEPQIASLAAERATGTDIRRMKRLLEKQREQVESGSSGVEADSELHFAIGQATQNHAIEKLVFGLLDVLSHSREESLQTVGRRQASIESHRAIVAAIERHDQAGARVAMRHHIEQVEQNVLLSRNESSEAKDESGWIPMTGDLSESKSET